MSNMMSSVSVVSGLRWLVRFDPVSKERRKEDSEHPEIILAGDSAGATQAYNILQLAVELHA